MYKSGYFISIGAGKNQLPLILKVKELGLKVISVDQNENAPGFIHSDIKIIQSVLEYRKIYSILLKLFLDEPIFGIGVRSFGKAVITASYLSDKLSLIGIKPEIVKPFYNKKTMKAALGEKGVLVPNSYDWQNIEDISQFIKTVNFPCILKPINSTGKQGIEVFSKVTVLEERLRELKTRSSEFLLEEFILGKEVTVIGLVQNKKFNLISLSDKVTTTYPPFIELSHRLPSVQSKFIGEIKLICQNIVSHTGLENSPLVAEFKITTLGQVYLMEVMPEIGGEYLAEYLVPEFYFYDYFQNYIRIQTGLPFLDIPEMNKKNKTMQAQICFIAPPEGKSKFASTVKKSSLSGKVFLDENLKKEGDVLDTMNGNACRVKVIGVSSLIVQSSDEFDKTIRECYDTKFK